MMRYPLFFLLGYFCSSDVHPFIHLHGIIANYFTIKFLCYFDGELGFSYSRWPNDNDKLMFHTITSSIMIYFSHFMLHDSFEHFFHFILCEMNNDWSSMWACKWLFTFS